MGGVKCSQSQLAMSYLKKPCATPNGFFAPTQLPPPPPPPPPPVNGSVGMYQQPQFLYNYSNMRQPFCPIPPPPPPPPPPPGPTPAAATARSPSHRSNIHSGRHMVSRQAPGRPTMSPGSLRLPPAAAHLPAQPIEYRCESCKLTLDSSTALQSHLTGHIKCRACSFQGSPKVVRGHYEATHGKFAGRGWRTITVAVPGCPIQRFRICVGNHPDDVQQWIADRKKRFPRTSKSLDAPAARPATPPPWATPPDYRDPKEHNPTNPGQAATVPPTPAIAALLDGYGSSSSSNDELDSAAGNELPRSGFDTGSMSERRDAFPQSEIVPTSSTLATTTALASAAAARSVLRRPEAPCHGRTTRLNPRFRSRQSTTHTSLLRKLLANDVRRDVALTLQLLDYIVETNFLENNNNNHTTSVTDGDGDIQQT